MKDSRNKKLLAIATAMPEFADDPVEIYWLTKRFFKMTETFKESIPIMVCKLQKQIFSNCSFD